VISVPKPGNDLVLLLSYRPVSLLDNIDNLFGKILLARMLQEVSARELMRDEMFGFRHTHSTSFLLSRLAERITRNLGEKRLSGAVFLDVANTFDTVWIYGLLYKRKLLRFPSYIVHIISSHLWSRTFEAFFQTATPSRLGMRAVVAQGGLICPVSSVCMSTTCPHYRTTSCQPSTQTTRPSYPRLGSRRCSSTTWSHTSTFLNSG